MSQIICKSMCDRCSCKGEVISLDTPYLSELYELWIDWKTTGKIFPCYIRQNGQGCYLHHKQILRIDKNIEKVMKKLRL